MSHTTTLIDKDPAIMTGKPRIRGTRITVEHILELYAGGWTMEDILEGHQDLNEAAILAARHPEGGVSMLEEDTFEKSRAMN